MGVGGSEEPTNKKAIFLVEPQGLDALRILIVKSDKETLVIGGEEEAKGQCKVCSSFNYGAQQIRSPFNYGAQRRWSS